jgi:hypothetical protein
MATRVLEACVGSLLFRRFIGRRAAGFRGDLRHKELERCGSGCNEKEKAPASEGGRYRDSEAED